MSDAEIKDAMADHLTNSLHFLWPLQSGGDHRVEVVLARMPPRMPPSEQVKYRLDYHCDWLICLERGWLESVAEKGLTVVEAGLVLSVQRAGNSCWPEGCDACWLARILKSPIEKMDFVTQYIVAWGGETARGEYPERCLRRLMNRTHRQLTGEEMP